MTSRDALHDLIYLLEDTCIDCSDCKEDIDALLNKIERELDE